MIVFTSISEDAYGRHREFVKKIFKVDET